MRHSRASNGFWVLPPFAQIGWSVSLNSLKFRNVNIHSGEAAYFTIDSLSAFWPGLQVLAGDVENAIKAHLMCNPHVFDAILPSLIMFTAVWNLWKKFSGMPEVFDTAFLQVTSWQYPLRPGTSLESRPRPEAHVRFRIHRIHLVPLPCSSLLLQYLPPTLNRHTGYPRSILPRCRRAGSQRYRNSG